MLNQNSPSRKPGEGSDLSDVLGLAIRKELLDMEDMLPASIVSYDRLRNRAQVSILYSVTMTDGSVNSMSAPAEIPGMVFGGGGIVLTFNLQPGDLGWIKASDRDLSLFQQSYKEEPGNTPRIHCFEDGVFIPDVMKGFIPVDNGATCLQTMDGSTAIAIKQDSIVLSVGSLVFKLTPDGVESNKPITAPQFTDGTINTIGHVHSNPEGGNVGPMKNP
ncbi:baseplate spike protein [Yersinia phage vB_YenM_P744]